MAVDSKGMNQKAVFRPVFTVVRYAPAATAFPTAAELDAMHVSPAAPTDVESPWLSLGLTKQGGGHQWTLEREGDDIEFEQEGYAIKSGLSTATLELTVAEYSEQLRALRGQVEDVDGMSVLDASGDDSQLHWFVTEVDASGKTRHRLFKGSAKVAEEQSTRGEYQGFPVTVTISRELAWGGHIKELYVVPAGQE